MSEFNFKPEQKSVFWRLRPPERRAILIAGDLIVSIISMCISLYFWAQLDNWYNFSFSFIRDRVPFWFFILPLVWMILLIEIYDIRRAGRRDQTIQTILIAAITCFVFYLIIYFSSMRNTLPRQSVAIYIVSISVLTALWRLTYIKVFTHLQFLRRVIIVGAGRSGSTLINIIQTLNPPPFIVVGLIDDEKTKIGTKLENFPVLGSNADLLAIIKKENITDLVFAISGEMSNEMLQSIWIAEEQGIEVTTMPTMYEELLGRVPISLLQSDWILRSFVDQAHTGGFFDMVKRIMDILGSLVGIVFTALLYPFIALAIFIDDGFPVLYHQDRLGKNGEVYSIIKFRTMFNDPSKGDNIREPHENLNRITRVGKILRKSHVDEFPQFLNILRGDMSLVGPRAERIELVNDLQNKVPFYRARLLVKPGLTGWAQINYGYASTVEETKTKLEYDLYYIKHRNLILDFVIILRTIPNVIFFRGQ